METKYLTPQLLAELLENEKYYYIEGTCPELCTLRRLVQYAQGIVKNNLDDIPQGLREVYNESTATEIILWFGETVLEAGIQSNSAEYIKNLDTTP